MLMASIVADAIDRDVKANDDNDDNVDRAD